MCGIAGIFDPERRPLANDLAPMVRIQRHRGPDAEGTLVTGPIAIGMRRLSIIDISGGNQPIFNEDRTIAVVLNGEIFNFVELRQELLHKGHVFRTMGDTETLVHLYEEYGEDCVERLNGMFAFALWDSRTRSVLLSRDRMGVKPLYYCQAGSRWLFGSELKSILTQPEADSTIDLESIADFLRLSYIPRESTPYRFIRKLLPGHSLVISPTSSRLVKWWNLEDVQARGRDLESALESLFDDSVKIRMRSDVPVASFLSGGLDSSLVTIAAQQDTDEPIKTFSIGFEHSEFDELPYARAVSRHARTCHAEHVVRTHDAIQNLPLLLWHLDEPIGDSSIVPNYLVSRLAAQSVKVCLSGLGGDELFGGYARYLDPGLGRIRMAFSRAPRAAAALSGMVGRFHYSWGEELRIASGPAQDWRAYLHRLQVLDSRHLRQLGFPALGRTESIVEQLWNRFPGNDPITRLQFIDQSTYLPDQILALTDRMSMANSLEVRVPFMDYRLVRFSQALSAAEKQDSGDFKIFLKRVLGKRCPPELMSRPKWGFDTPLKTWVGQPDIYGVMQGLPAGAAVRLGLIRASSLRDMLSSPEMAKNRARRLWNVLVLDCWLRIHRRLEAPHESLCDIMEEASCQAR